MALVITTNATEGLNMLTGTQFLFDAQDPGGTNSQCRQEVDLLNGRWELTPGSASFEDAIGFENVDGGTGAETLRGSNDANRLYGNNGNDTIFGNGDSDTLRGGAGDDSIRGGSENDFIRGDAGADYLAGDAGDDRFEYYAGTTTGADSVFGNTGTDTIWLSGAATFDFQTQGRTILATGRNRIPRRWRRCHQDADRDRR
ncbi:Hemolysin, chromosomal [Nymphon striatum]|nr:Hemolysin, chromosomal [Nymphon striatum]